MALLKGLGRVVDEISGGLRMGDKAIGRSWIRRATVGKTVISHVGDRDDMLFKTVMEHYGDLARRYPNVARNIRKVQLFDMPANRELNFGRQVGGWAMPHHVRAAPRNPMGIDRAGGTIHLNLRELRDSVKFNDVGEEWTAVRLNDYKTAVRDTLSHEFGHHVNYSLGGQVGDVTRGMGRGLRNLGGSTLPELNLSNKLGSEYALTNYDEMFAETFTRAQQPGSGKVRGLKRWEHELRHKVRSNAIDFEEHYSVPFPHTPYEKPYDRSEDLNEGLLYYMQNLAQDPEDAHAQFMVNDINRELKSIQKKNQMASSRNRRAKSRSKKRLKTDSLSRSQAFLSNGHSSARSGLPVRTRQFR